jgi:hypothetical protein
MTNYEMIKGLILHDKLDNLAHFMCESMDYISEGYSCEYCPVRDKCEAARMNGNGWFHWLREEAKE